jgi:hypothetical protein
MPRAARAHPALGGAVGSRKQRNQQVRAMLDHGARLEDGVAEHPIAPQITSEDGTNRAHGLEETLYQHVTLEPEQTKRYGAARLCTVPPRSYVEGGRSHGPRPSEG